MSEALTLGQAQRLLELVESLGSGSRETDASLAAFFAVQATVRPPSERDAFIADLCAKFNTGKKELR